MPYSQTSAFVFENKEALNYLGICDVGGECAHGCVPARECRPRIFLWE